jgi:hypothetical protein
MAEAVGALAADVGLRERFGAAGYQYALTNLDRDAVLARFEANLLNLVSSKITD